MTLPFKVVIELVIVILEVAVVIETLVTRLEVAIQMMEAIAATIATRGTTTKYRWVTVIVVLV